MTRNHYPPIANRLGLAFAVLSLLFFSTSCSESEGDVAKAAHQYEVKVSGLVWMGCASDVGTAFKNIEGVTAHDVRPNEPVKLGSSRELTEEELAKSLPSKYGITEFKVVK